MTTRPFFFEKAHTDIIIPFSWGGVNKKAPESEEKPRKTKNFFEGLNVTEVA